MTLVISVLRSPWLCNRSHSRLGNEYALVPPFISIHVIIGMGRHSSMLTKTVIGMGSGLSGLALGSAFGVQKAMGHLEKLDSPLGEALRRMDELRARLRKCGTEEGAFSGEAVDAERDRLARTFTGCPPLLMCRDI